MQTTQDLTRSLAAEVAAGRLRPGDQFPPVRALASEQGCATSTVARAYLRLRDAGVVGGNSAATASHRSRSRPVPGHCCATTNRCA